ncbi:MAG: hypothetical protein U9O87_07830 [Verrucomicrobiota bacterium]|nr:hypothetical protein [Verrucomicrobiota bacterium]
MKKNNLKYTEELIDRLHDGELSYKDNKELVALLESSEEAFKLYIEKVNIHVSLAELWRGNEVEIKRFPRGIKQKKLKFFHAIATIVAIVILSFLILSILSESSSDNSKQVFVERKFSKNSSNTQSVRKALLWLKNTQSKDGFWTSGKKGKYRRAITALALISFLDAEDEKGIFKLTINRAVEFLLNSQGQMFKNYSSASGGYENPIVLSALAKAVKNGKCTDESSVRILCGKLIEEMSLYQNNDGSWSRTYSDYQLNADIAVTQWHLRALQSVAQVGFKDERIKKSVRKAELFMKNARLKEQSLEDLCIISLSLAGLGHTRMEDMKRQVLQSLDNFPKGGSLGCSIFKLNNLYNKSLLLCICNADKQAWWQEKIRELEQIQSSDGSWNFIPENLGQKNVECFSTIFCSLILQKSKDKYPAYQPDMIAKL